MPARITLDHTVIKSSNFDVSDDFYRRVFGVEVVKPIEGFRVYRLGNVQLNVHGPDMEIPAHLLAKTPVMAGNSDMAFEWDGPVEDALAHLHACGVESHTGIVDTFGRRGKARSVYFRDPDGSLLEFITYPDGDNDQPPVTPDWARDA
jgi:catechol 2,3-dioxygenase-like lactoylglutathione lyase family enzyme